MGSYTTNLNFYKPAATEFVDPGTQLNRNWDIADYAVRQTLEHQYTALAVPDVTVNTVRRARFYKPYSNSLMTWFESNSSWVQDPTAKVDPWNPDKSILIEGYFEHPDLPLFYRKVQKAGSSTAEVEFIGAIWGLGGPMELNVTTSVATALAPEYRPATNKYFTMWAGNTSSDYSITRILIAADGHIEFKRYGVNPSGGSSVENRIELTGIKYCVEVTGS